MYLQKVGKNKKKFVFCRRLEGHWRKERIRIRQTKVRIRGSGCHGSGTLGLTNSFYVGMYYLQQHRNQLPPPPHLILNRMFTDSLLNAGLQPRNTLFLFGQNFGRFDLAHFPPFPNARESERNQRNRETCLRRRVRPVWLAASSCIRRMISSLASLANRCIRPKSALTTAKPPG